MSAWLTSNQKSILYVLVLLLLGTFALYVYVVLPIADKAEERELELASIEQRISVLQTELAERQEQTMTAAEQQRLLAGVPPQPYVEQVLVEMERAEQATGVVIEHVSVVTEPNTEEEETWRHVFDGDMYDILRDKVVDLENLTVSYVELQLNVSGAEENMRAFVSGLEQSERTLHVTNYTFMTDNDDDAQNDSVTGTVTLHAFFTEDFAPYVTVTAPALNMR